MIASILAAGFSGILASLLQAPVWAAVIIGLLFLVAVLFFRLPVRGLEIEQNVESDKLSLRIVEGMVGPVTTTGGPESQLLFIVAVVNTKDPDVTVSRWELKITRADGTDWTDGHVDRIRPQLRYSLDGQSERNVGQPFTQVRLDEETFTHGLIPGIGRQGWLMFRTYVRDFHHLFGARFILTAVDALEGKSQVVKMPGDWLKRAHFTQQVDEPLVLPSPPRPEPTTRADSTPQP